MLHHVHGQLQTTDAGGMQAQRPLQCRHVSRTRQDCIVLALACATQQGQLRPTFWDLGPQILNDHSLQGTNSHSVAHEVSGQTLICCHPAHAHRADVLHTPLPL